VPCVRLRDPIVPHSLAGPVLVDALGRPRYWASYSLANHTTGGGRRRTLLQRLGRLGSMGDRLKTGRRRRRQKIRALPAAVVEDLYELARAVAPKPRCRSAARKNRRNATSPEGAQMRSASTSFDDHREGPRRASRTSESRSARIGYVRSRCAEAVRQARREAALARSAGERVARALFLADLGVRIYASANGLPLEVARAEVRRRKEDRGRRRDASEG
jgi:hypothetical protein